MGWRGVSISRGMCEEATLDASTTDDDFFN